MHYACWWQASVVCAHFDGFTWKFTNRWLSSIKICMSKKTQMSCNVRTNLNYRLDFYEFLFFNRRQNSCLVTWHLTVIDCFPVSILLRFDLGYKETSQFDETVLLLWFSQNHNFVFKQFIHSSENITV